jgi:hypothetical protein
MTVNMRTFSKVRERLLSDSTFLYLENLETWTICFDIIHISKKKKYEEKFPKMAKNDKKYP